MEGWQTENRGFVLGKDIAKAASPPQRNRTSNQLKPQKTLSNRIRASKRFKGAQGKVLRAVRVQRAMMGVQKTRQNARNNWQRGVNKMATVMGFKRLGIDAVQRRKRSIFGNLMTGAIIDDSSMPRVSLHDLNDAEQKLSQHNRRGSAISSMVFSQRPAAAPSPLRRPASTTRSSSPKTIVPEVAPMIVRRDDKATAESVAKQMKRQELKKKMKGAVGKVQKFVRTVRLSYSDTFSGKNKVSLTDLLGRLRKHYDPDGIHADPHDGQHAFYTDLALLQRESLKHDARVRSKFNDLCRLCFLCLLVFVFVCFMCFLSCVLCLNVCPSLCFVPQEFLISFGPPRTRMAAVRLTKKNTWSCVVKCIELLWMILIHQRQMLKLGK
jgi:hypothetical protein